MDYFHYCELLSTTIDALYGYNYSLMTISKELLLLFLVVVMSNNFLKRKITNKTNPQIFYINKHNIFISPKSKGKKKKHGSQPSIKHITCFLAKVPFFSLLILLNSQKKGMNTSHQNNYRKWEWESKWNSRLVTNKVSPTSQAQDSSSLPRFYDVIRISIFS